MNWVISLSENGLVKWCCYHRFEKGEGGGQEMKAYSVGEVVTCQSMILKTLLDDGQSSNDAIP